MILRFLLLLIGPNVAEVEIVIFGYGAWVLPDDTLMTNVVKYKRKSQVTKPISMHCLGHLPVAVLSTVTAGSKVVLDTAN